MRRAITGLGQAIEFTGGEFRGEGDQLMWIVAINDDVDVWPVEPAETR